MNFMRGKVLQEQQQLHFVLEHQGRSTLLPIPAAQAAAIQRLAPANGEIVLGIRPEHVTDAASARRAEHSETYSDAHHPTEVDCIVELTEPTGPDTLVFSSFNATRLTCRTHPRAAAMPGQPMRLAFDLSKAVFFDPVSEQSLK